MILVDTESGELLVEANAEITPEVLDSNQRKRKYKTIQIIYTNNLDQGPYMS
jgi:DNA-directed RNA polymerase subunit beta